MLYFRIPTPALPKGEGARTGNIYFNNFASLRSPSFGGVGEDF